MSASMQRRQFVKLSAMAAAAAALGIGTGETTTARAASSGRPGAGLGRGVRWQKAPCRFCGTGCHVMVGVEGDRVVGIAGDPDAAVNRGLLCVKGYHVGLALYGADRLTRPLLRRDGKLQPVEWDEAIDVLAQRIMREPKGFAFYGSGQWTIPEGYAAQKLMKAGLGNNNIEPNARLCMASAVTGYLSTYGVDEPAGCFEDLDACDVLLFWGANSAEMHPVLFSRVVDRRSRGESVLLIDLGTRRTRTTGQCQHFLQFRPQTDLAIANGIAHLLLRENTYDHEFVARHCAFRADSDPPALPGRAITFEEYQRALEPYTPEYVEQLSGVSAADIRMLAGLYGRRDLRITSLWCMGMNQHTRGTAINSLVHGVHLLSGHFGRPGDAPTSLTGQPSACGTAREVGTFGHGLPGGRLVAKAEHRAECEKLWRVPAGRIPPTPGPHTVEMWRRFCTPSKDGGDIHTLWTQVTNPGQSLPNLPKLFLAKRNLADKFLVVSDVYPTATTELADLVLPSALWVEKNGMFGNSERRTQQWFRMVSPPGDARDDCWQTIAVAHRLLELGHTGMKDTDGRFLFETRDESGTEVPVWTWNHYYDVNVDRRLFEEYRAFTRLKHKDLAPYDEYVKARGLRWPVVEQPDGSWQETRYRFVEGEDPYVSRGAGVQFYHSTTGDDRAQIWFRPYEAAAEPPDASFPMWLCTGRVLEHWHTGTMTMRVPQLRRAMPAAYVEVNEDDAVDMGIRTGDQVRITTRRGSLELPAWIGGRGSVARGTLFVPFFDETRLVNLLTTDAHDPFSKQPDYKKCAAKAERIVGES